jgi:hypothetical protein
MLIYLIVGMLLSIVVEFVLLTESLTIANIPSTIGEHNSTKPYSDAELEPT